MDLDRIARERQKAMDRYLKDRDATRLAGAMVDLDRDQAALVAPRPAEPVPADVAVRFLRELPKTWAKAKGGQGRALLATALFDRIEVLGMREATVSLSAHAVRHGLATVLPAELRIPVYGRGERSQADTMRVKVRSGSIWGRGASGVNAGSALDRDQP